MSSLLPPNASQLLRDLEAATNWLTELPVEQIKAIIDPYQCPAVLLPWLAWAWSVDQWDSGWTEQVKRQVLADSPAWHRIKGTPEAVQRLLDAQGIETLVREWWELDDAAPHAFRVELTGDTPLSVELIAQILTAVAAGKNARSYMDRLRVGRRADLGLSLGHALGLGYHYRVPPRLEFLMDDGDIYVAHPLRTARATQVHPQQPDLGAETSHSYYGGALRTARITEIHPHG